MTEYRAFKQFEARHGQLEPAAKMFRELNQNAPWIHARRVAVTFDGVSNTADVLHGLGRAYTGGWIGDTPGAASLSGGGGGGGGLAKHDTTHSPLGLWQFDQDLTDSSGNGEDLTQGTERYGPAPAGVGGVFTGGGPAYRLNPTAFELRGAMSGYAHIRPTTLATTGRYVVATYGSHFSGETNNYIWDFGLVGVSGIAGYAYYRHQGNVTTYRELTSIVGGSSGVRASVDDWIWLGFTRDSAGTGVKLFINGVKIKEGTLGSAPTGGTSANCNLFIGALSGGTGGDFLGSISSVAIVNSELTEAQMLSLYETTLGAGGGGSSQTLSGTRAIVTGDTALAAGVDVTQYARFVQGGTPVAETIYGWVY